MTKFVFFGGKGGVGKTTMSSAYAVKCSKKGKKCLIVSTDPAHSTSDIFDQDFGDKPKKVTKCEDIWTIEIDPEKEISRHSEKVKEQMNKHVSASIVNEINTQIELAHKAPGSYEAALFDRFIDIMRESEKYDRVIFDTSPTGATLRLLSLPKFLERWIERLIEKRTKSINLFEKAAIGDKEARKKIEEDPIINHLNKRKEKFQTAKNLLRQKSKFYFVLTPERLSVLETKRAVENLAEYELYVSGLIINKITPLPEEKEKGKAARYLRERHSNELNYIEDINNQFEEPIVARIESRPEEVKKDILEEIAKTFNLESL